MAGRALATSRTRARDSGCRLAWARPAANASVSVDDHQGRHQFRLAPREGSGLVEDHRVDAAEFFQRRAILDHDAGAEQPAAGHHLHGGNGEAQRAGAGDDEHGDRRHQRIMPAVAEHQPADERGGRQRVHGGRIEARQPVGDADIARLALFGRRHQAHQFGEERVVAGRGDLDDQRAGEVEFAGMDLRCRACTVSGADSPVSSERSMSLMPSMTRPSAGSRSPAAMAMRMPGFRSRAAT